MRYAAIAMLLGGCAIIAAPGDADGLAAAERSFAAQSMRAGMASAFLANFADDGVLVADGWTTARAAFAGREPPPVDLDWAPAHVEVAASGELGLSTGPWIRRSRTQPQAPAAHGHFVSIWRREGTQPWKVEVDIGIAHPEAIPLPAAFESAAPQADGPAGETLEQAEARFAEDSLRRGAREAYAIHALARLLLYRHGHAPYRGKPAALAAQQLAAAPTSWKADAVRVARSGDFGYVRGSYSDAGDGGARGHFLRVWRRERGAWGIALDVADRAR